MHIPAFETIVYIEKILKIENIFAGDGIKIQKEIFQQNLVFDYIWKEVISERRGFRSIARSFAAAACSINFIRSYYPVSWNNTT